MFGHYSDDYIWINNILNGCLCEKNKNHLTNMSQNLNIVDNN